MHQDLICLTEAIEQFDADAMFVLAEKYKEGVVVAKNPSVALYWYRKAAIRGHWEAQGELADMYSYGEGGIDADDAEAFVWYHEAALRGSAWAQNELGYLYDDGRGVAKDPKEAVRWFRLAAEQGNADAQYNLGNMYHQGHGVDARDYEQAMRWYRLAAEQGDPYAQNNLGWLYERGLGVDEQSDQLAYEWCLKSAEGGCKEAQYAIGVMLELGIGVPPQINEAAAWYNRAEILEEPTAEMHARLLEARRQEREAATGSGVQSDRDSDFDAFTWYLEKAEQGNAAAMYNLATLYEKGIGVQKDLEAACIWFGKATEAGHGHSQDKLDYLKEKLDRIKSK